MLPQEALEQVFGYAAFRGCQHEVIARLMRGEHALLIMPTGMGKSLCYQIPAVATWPGDCGGGASDAKSLTLVISPLIALMKDQVDVLRARGVDAAYINSSLTRDERQRRYADVSAGAYLLLYVTPERFRKTEFLDVIAERSIRLLAVDEAHCISEWGHDFRPDYTRLAEFRRRLGDPTTIALTATATPEVQADIVEQLGLSASEVELFHEGIERPNLRLEVEEVWGTEAKLEQIHRELDGLRRTSGCGIVYFTLIRTLQEFSHRLMEDGLSHVCYHGELDRVIRREIQDHFMQGREELVLATNAFGMGIDKEDIRLVLHADLPGSLESYYQEIGRAGRDGLSSRCLLLYDQRDLMTQMEFVAWSNPDADVYQRVYDLLSQDLEKIQAFGVEWLREKLHFKDKHDHRLDTALAMLDRYGVIEAEEVSGRWRLRADLPPALTDAGRLADKLRRDQQKLLALVRYVHHQGDRKEYIHDYFGLPYEASRVS